MRESIKKSLAFLSPHQRWRWAAMLPLALAAAALETVGAAAGFLLIKVITDPAGIRQLPLASWIPARMVGGGREAVLWISLTVAVFYVFKNGLLGLFAY